MSFVSIQSDDFGHTVGNHSVDCFKRVVFKFDLSVRSSMFLIE